MNDRLVSTFTIDGFEAANVDPALFDHEAHVYVGWLFVMAFPRDEAIARFDRALQRLTVKIGATDKYNAMITWLFLMLIAERSRPQERWPAFRERNTDLFDGRPGLKAA